MARVAVIYYSATGAVHELAQAIRDGAVARGAEVRLRHVQEVAPADVIDANPKWRAHVDAIHGHEAASPDDLRWCDACVLGTPTRFGNITGALAQFIESLGPLWMSGELAGKVASSFTSAANPHGGHESTILALNNVFYSWGAIVVPPGYTDARVFAAGGNPFGASSTGLPGDAERAAAVHQGERVADVTERLTARATA